MASRHTLEQRSFIVRKLAAFVPPKLICAAFRAQWSDTDCQIEDVNATDPRMVLVPPELHTLFFTERERVMTDPNADPYTDTRAQLIVLSAQAEDYLARDDKPNVRTVFRHIGELTGALAKPTGKAGGKDTGAAPEVKEIKVTHTVIDPAPREQ